MVAAGVAGGDGDAADGVVADGVVTDEAVAGGSVAGGFVADGDAADAADASSVNWRRRCSICLVTAAAVRVGLRTSGFLAAGLVGSRTDFAASGFDFGAAAAGACFAAATFFAV